MYSVDINYLHMHVTHLCVCARVCLHIYLKTCLGLYRGSMCYGTRQKKQYIANSYNSRKKQIRYLEEGKNGHNDNVVLVMHKLPNKK